MDWKFKTANKRRYKMTIKILVGTKSKKKKEKPKWICQLTRFQKFRLWYGKHNNVDWRQKITNIKMGNPMLVPFKCIMTYESLTWNIFIYHLVFLFDRFHIKSNSCFTVISILLVFVLYVVQTNKQKRNTPVLCDNYTI